MKSIIFIIIICPLSIFAQNISNHNSLAIYDDIIGMYRQESKNKNFCYKIEEYTSNDPINLMIYKNEIEDVFHDDWAKISLGFTELNAQKKQFFKNKCVKCKGKNKKAVIDFSDIYYSGNYAIVYSGIQYSSLNGHGYIYIFIKNEERWLFVKKVKKWIS